MNTPAIQFASFGPGLGFVLHKVTLPGRSGRFSAWFDSAGNLCDAEHIRVNGTVARPIKQAISELRPIGFRYVGKQPERITA